MAEEIEFENHHFWNFKSHMTLNLTSDDLESHIVVNVSPTLTNTTIWFVAALCFIVDVRTYTDGRTVLLCAGMTFLPGLLGHLSGDDLKIGDVISSSNNQSWILSCRRSKTVVTNLMHVSVISTTALWFATWNWYRVNDMNWPMAWPPRLRFELCARRCARYK